MICFDSAENLKQLMVKEATKYEKPNTNLTVPKQEQQSK